MPSIRPFLTALAILCLGLTHALAANERVNINTADAATIARVLSGVGLTKAQAIVQHRETNGRFDAATDLTLVKGIGKATVDNNADKIVVSGSAGDGENDGGDARIETDMDKDE